VEIVTGGGVTGWGDAIALGGEDLFDLRPGGSFGALEDAQLIRRVAVAGGGLIGAGREVGAGAIGGDRALVSFAVWPRRGQQPDPAETSAAIAAPDFAELVARQQFEAGFTAGTEMGDIGVAVRCGAVWLGIAGQVGSLGPTRKEVEVRVVGGGARKGALLQVFSIGVGNGNQQRRKRREEPAEAA